jgi:hypothetical protein
MKQLKSLILFPNGNICAFDERDRQVQEINVESVPKMLGDLIERCGFDPTGVVCTTPIGDLKLRRSESFGWIWTDPRPESEQLSLRTVELIQLGHPSPNSGLIYHENSFESFPSPCLVNLEGSPAGVLSPTHTVGEMRNIRTERIEGNEFFLVGDFHALNVPLWESVKDRPAMLKYKVMGDGNVDSSENTVYGYKVSGITVYFEPYKTQ